MWDRIDAHIMGCKMCGALHICEVGYCDKCVVVDGYEVCEISGICLRPAQSECTQEFYDTVLYTNTPCEMKEFFCQNFARIESYVSELLLSETTYEIWKTKLLRTRTRAAKELESLSSDKRSFIERFEMVICNNIKKHHISFAYNESLRRQTMKVCVSQIYHTLSLCAKKFKLGIKNSDLRNTVFGLMYLMREGITFGNICIMPKIECLHCLLPAESCLYKSFGFKPKFITDIENKCKFAFRTGAIDNISMQNFTQRK